MKKLFALMLALALMVTVVCAFAEGDGGDTGGGQTTPATGTNSTPSITIKTKSDDENAARDETHYTWYRILEADIGTDPSINDGGYQSGGAVSYYTNSQAKATALEGTGVFTVTQVGTTNSWLVELVNPRATGAEIAAAIAGMDLSLFPTGTFNQEDVAGTATSGPVDPGYYYIISTAGKNVAVQTLTAVEIVEKNTFPTIEKKVDDDDKNAQIGDEITFTLTVMIPSTANDEIVLTDTMTAGLSYKAFESVLLNGTDVAAGTNTYSVTPAADGAGFTLTFTPAFVASAAAAADEGTLHSKIEIECTAVLDGEAQTANPESNSLVLDYGQYYTSLPKTAEVNTYEYLFNKVDGNNGKHLAGAEFQLMLGSTLLKVVKTGDNEYRVAMPDETEATETITTNGETVRIYGLDSDINNYKLQETKAPTGGYNVLTDPVPITPGKNPAEVDIENNEGVVLPSTGGSGTTIFYVIGGLLIIGAGIVLVARRKVHE